MNENQDVGIDHYKPTIRALEVRVLEAVDGFPREMVYHALMSITCFYLAEEEHPREIGALLADGLKRLAASGLKKAIGH
jgi:hypothetical protein